MANAKKAAQAAEEGPAAAAFSDGVGEVDEKVNPAQDVLQETVDKAEDRGFLGVETDPTPNEHYTVDGVIAGKPTPETEKGNA